MSKKTKQKITGLTSEEVALRIAENKVNGDINVKTKSIAQILRTNILTFFNLLFAVIGVLMAFFITYDINGIANYGFVLVALVNCTIGITQEILAKKTIDKLSLLSAPKVIALRDGKEIEISIKDIVLDDVIKLEPGSQICADAIVIDGNIEVNESLITGESDAIIKKVGDTLLSGSFIISGTAYSQITHIGKDNYVAKITENAKKLKTQSSEIYCSLMKIIKIMSAIIIPIGISLFCVKYFLQGSNDLNATVLTVLGTIIGMIPSGLVALTSAVFCVSVVRLAQKQALAQDLYASEILARVDVLCLDKTGTITEGVMEVADIIAKENTKEEIKVMLKSLSESISDNNSTAQAIKEFTKDVTTFDKAISVNPFSSDRKWSGATFENYSLIMGAAEFTFKNLSEQIKKEIASYSEKGLRVIALASSTNKISNNALPTNLKLAGFVLIADKIRESAPQTLAYFDEQGVEIKIISGDNPITVKSVAERAGVKNAQNYVDATTLKTEADILEAAEKYTVFGRVTPEQKLMLIKALKTKGHVVGMTGDGINDVMALREADCSIAVASGSDASKNVSKIVLMNSDFSSLPSVVAEGRRCINNLQRSATLFLTKTIFSTLFAIIFLFISTELPFMPKNLALIGWVNIAPPAFILALEPNKDIVKGRFITTVLKNSLPTAITIVIAVVTITLAAPALNISSDQLSTISVMVTGAIGLTYIAKLCWPLNKTRIALLAVLILFFIACFFVPFLQAFFGICPDFNSDMFLLAGPVFAGSIFILFGLSELFKHVKLKKKVK